MDASFSFCNSCKTRSKCKKVCANVERWLRRQGIYSADWIRPMISSKKRKDGLGPWREIPFSMLADIKSDNDKLLEDNEL